MSKLTPFTPEHFRLYTSKLVLDTGQPWELEAFQEKIVLPILEGETEVWAILPEGNAKTTLMAGVALYHCDFTYSPWVPIGASSREQAEILARQAYDMIRRSPGMLQRFRIFEGYREIRSLRNGGRGIKVYAADPSTADGAIPTLALCDEGHRWPDLAVYRLWKGKLNKRGGQIVMISTAGAPGEEFEEMRDSIRNNAAQIFRDGAHVRSEAPGIVMNEWMVEKPRLITNIEAVKRANPLSTITIDTLADEFNSPTTDLGDWKRLKCNIPARSANTAITEAEWDGARLDESDIPAGAVIDLGADVAWKHDTFSIVPLWDAMRDEGFRLFGDPAILTPPRDGSTMHPDVVKRAFEVFLEEFVVEHVVIDIERAEEIAAWLRDDHSVTVIDWTQNNAQKARDYESFMRGLRDGTLRHTGNKEFRKHVMNAVARPLPNDKKRFDRPSESRARRKQVVRVIDALTAAEMIHSFQVERASAPSGLVGTVADYRIVSMVD